MADIKDPFYSAKFSLERGREHIEAFVALQEEFFSSSPFEMVEEAEVGTDYTVTKIRLVKPMPDRLTGLARDAVSNIRASLDLVLAAFNGGKKTLFPFASDAAHFETGVNGRCKDLPSEIVGIIRNIHPYKTGNVLLWALNELSNEHKHAIIEPVAMSSTQVLVSGTTGQGGSMSMPPPRWDSEKNEMELMRVREGTRAQFSFDCEASIVFRGVNYVDGRDVSDTLTRFATQVGYILETFEFQAEKCGL